jgi:hypothetical protein
MRTKKTVAILQARIDQLEAHAANANEEPRASRRGMLRLAGAAAVGGLAAAVTSQPAAATDGAAVLAGVSLNTATLPTGIDMGPGTPIYGLGCYEHGLPALSTDLGRPALFGFANGAAFTKGVAGHNTMSGGDGVIGLDTATGGVGHGVRGQSNSGFGVWAFSAVGTAVAATSGTGIGVFAQGGAGAIGFGGGSFTAPPSRGGTYTSNTLEADGNRDVWFCYESGTPGKWRKLAGPATAGAFHAITPTRVYDSRAAAPTPGLLDAGNNRLVSVANGRDNNGTVTTPNLVPAGATAVAANVTVTGTTGVGGYLAVNPGGVTAVSASTINWFGAGQNIANGVTLTLNTNRELTVICGDGGGSTHFIVDIAGYYR